MKRYIIRASWTIVAISLILAIYFFIARPLYALIPQPYVSLFPQQLPTPPSIPHSLADLIHVALQWLQLPSSFPLITELIVIGSIALIAVEFISSLRHKKKPVSEKDLLQKEPELLKAAMQAEKERLRLELWRQKRKPSGTIAYVLLLFGATSLTLSILYSSLIPAFIGLGLAFWGALLLYIKPTRYVKATLLDSTAISTLTTIDRVIANLNYKGKGIYLPPRYLKEIKSGTIFIPSEKTVIIPPIEEVAQEKFFLKNPNGICLTPPGLGLANLYENELGTDFSKVDLNYLQNNLPKLFVEGLEIAEDLELNSESNPIHIKIVGSIYADFCNKVRKLSSNICSLGCPLCSSIAIALTRTTGKPIIIEKAEASEDGKTIEVYYQILE